MLRDKSQKILKYRIMNMNEKIWVCMMRKRERKRTH